MSAVELPDRAWDEAEQAADDVTASNASEYARAGMHVGARWGAERELSTVHAQLITDLGPDHPIVAVIVRRIARLRGEFDEDYVAPGWSGPPDQLVVIRAAYLKARDGVSAESLMLAPLLRELHVTAYEGMRPTWALRDALLQFCRVFTSEEDGAR